jgi:hypothetical protein
VGTFAVGTDVFSARAAVSGVTNASLKEGVGVTVFAAASNAKASGVCVGMTGMGDEVGGMPPSAVGVAYCPHKDAFPLQDASKKDAAIIELIRRFTK